MGASVLLHTYLTGKQVAAEGRPPHLHTSRSLQNWRRSRIITGCSVHARNVWGSSDSL